MRAAAAAENLLRVDRVIANYQVSRYHPAPEALKRRLDEALSKDLAGSLSSLLSTWFSGSDSSVWLIRRLEVDLDLNAASDRERIARSWAAELGRSLADNVAGGADGSNVVWFPDRVAFLAQFLLDIATNSAWTKWWYREFEGCRALEPSVAIRTVVERPREGLEALLRLPPGSLDRVLRAVKPSDAQRILDQLASAGGSAGLDSCIDALAAVLDAGEVSWHASGVEARDALSLYLTICKVHRTIAGSSLRDVILAWVRLQRLIKQDPGKARALTRAISAGDPGALRAAAGPEGEVWFPLLTANVEKLLPILGDPATSETGGQRWTRHGGIFLLLPFLDELAIEALDSVWPVLDGSDPSHIVRLLLVAKCCGRAAAASAFSDALLRDLLGVSPKTTMASLADWAAKLDPSSLEPAEGAAKPDSSRCYVMGKTHESEAETAVLIDVQDGRWVWAKRVERVSRECPGVEVLDIRSAESTGESERGLREVLARLELLDDELRFLSLRGVLPVPAELDLALSLLAQSALRAMAGHLPGFAWSSIPHLFANFLDFEASLEETPERFVVRLGNPTLGLVLNRTTLASSSYRLSWLGERPIALFRGS